MIHRFVANVAGVIGYLLTLLSWIWSAMLLFTETAILESLDRDPDTEIQPMFKLPEFSLPEPIVTIFATTLVVTMVGLSIYLAFKAPATTVRTSSRVLHKSADKALATIQRRQSIPAKKRMLITARLVFYSKLILILLPVSILGGFIFITSPAMELESDLTIMISSTASLLALVSFTTQYGLAKLLKVPPSKLL